MSKRKPAAMTAHKKSAPAAMTIPAKTGSRGLTQEQLTEIAEKIFAPIRERQALFNSPKLKTMLNAFRDVIRREGVVGQEAVTYAKPGEYPFTASEFRMAFEAVMDHAPGEQKVAKTKSGGFGVFSKTYKGLEFTVIIGQGSSYSVSKAPKP